MNFDRLTWIGRTDSGVVRQRLYDRNIGTLLLSPLDPGRKPWLTAIRKEGGKTGYYIDPHWYGLQTDGNALRFRQKCDEVCGELQAGEMLMLDLELVSPDYVSRVLNGSPGNRGLIGSGRPGYGGTQEGRLLAYTNMPFQNHTVVPFDVIWDSGMTWWPQLYYGNMSPADEAAVCLEILRDFRAWVGADFSERIHPFYDGKFIATDQRDGGWFTAERIPGVFAPTLAAARLFTQAKQGGRRHTRDYLREYYTQLAEAA